MRFTPALSSSWPEKTALKSVREARKVCLELFLDFLALAIFRATVKNIFS